MKRVTVDLARHVLDAYDGVEGAREAVEALLPHATYGPLPALIVTVAMSVGCAQERFVPVEVQAVPVTAAEQRAGAIGAALYACLEEESTNEILSDSFTSVWTEIRQAREQVGESGVCVQSAALLACNAGQPWGGVDHYLTIHPKETCRTILAAVDSSRANRSDEKRRQELIAAAAK